MANTNDLHVVLGGTGGVGSAVVRELVARGKQVRVVTHTQAQNLPAGVEFMAGDVSNSESARAVSEGASVIYLCTNPAYNKWAELFPPMLKGAIAGASASNAKLVFADNLYVYAPTSKPMTEDLPYAPITRKGKVRVQMDETLMAAHANGTVRAAIGRASNYYGPDAPNSNIGDRFFKALLAGKPVEWMGKLDLPHTLSFTDDFARGLVVLGERDEALGQAWHIPAADPVTGHEFIQLAGEVAGVQAKAQEVPELMLRALGLFNPIIRELVEMLYEFQEPYIMNSSKFQRAFGFTPTPHRQA
nr:NAD-dependent epimerase/dehydratase family protein [Ktedonobacteraceae bacterium]